MNCSQPLSKNKAFMLVIINVLKLTDINKYTGSYQKQMTTLTLIPTWPHPPPNLGSEHCNSNRSSPSFTDFQPLIGYNLILEAKGNMTQCSVQSILKWTGKIKTVSQLTRKLYIFFKSGMFSAYHMLIILEARIKHINKILADIQISWQFWYFNSIRFSR